MNYLVSQSEADSPSVWSRDGRVKGEKDIFQVFLRYSLSCVFDVNCDPLSGAAREVTVSSFFSAGGVFHGINGVLNDVVKRLFHIDQVHHSQNRLRRKVQPYVYGVQLVGKDGKRFLYQCLERVLF